MNVKEQRSVLLRASRSRAIEIIGPIGQLIFHEREVEQVVEHQVQVQSSRKDRTYTVTLNRFGKAGNHQCSCPDWIFNRGANGKGKCKHIMRVLRDENRNHQVQG